MFRHLTHLKATKELRIGFIVQNVNLSDSQLTKIVEKGICESAYSINMKANVLVLSAEQAINMLPKLDGLFISGKQKEKSGTVIFSPAEPNKNLTVLLERAITNKVPVLSTSRGFGQMNNALLTTESNKENTWRFIKPNRVAETSELKTSANCAKTRHSQGIEFAPYGLLGKMFPGRHYQQIKIENNQKLHTLSPVLMAEACTEDGAIVAFSLKSKKSFYLAVNWRIQFNEHRVLLNQQLISRFILACQKFNKTAKTISQASRAINSIG